jgi:hypothetical protein
MKTTYELVKKDEQTWVNIEPLMNDVLDALTKMKDIKTDTLSDTVLHQLNLKILGLESIYTFLGGLVSEQNLKELRTKYGVTSNDTTIVH